MNNINIQFFCNTFHFSGRRFVRIGKKLSEAFSVFVFQVKGCLSNGCVHLFATLQPSMIGMLLFVDSYRYSNDVVCLLGLKAPS